MSFNRRPPALPLISLILLVGIPASAQTASDFYGESEIQDVYLEVHPDDWAALRRNYLENTYYQAQFRWRDITLPGVGIRSRGSGSRSPLKPNLKIDFERFQKPQNFVGLSSTILKANNGEPSMIRERAAMAIFDLMGVPVPRETYVRLHVNGEFFGLYNLIEDIDKDFLERVYGDDNGYLYDWESEPTGAGYRFQYLGGDPAGYSPVMFKPVTHEKDPDPIPLVEMVRAANLSSDEEFVSAVSRYIDLEKFVRYLAAEMFMADFDGFLGDVFGMNNFYVYRPPGSTVHTFMPWDKDGTFIYAERSIMQGIEDNVLTRRLMQVPEYRNLYLDELQRAAGLAGADGGFLMRTIDRLDEQIREVARKDPHKQCSADGVQFTCGADEYQWGVDYIRAFTAARAAFVTREVQAARQ
jgi:spore coat protein CotH